MAAPSPRPLAANLRRLRVARGLSVVELARRARVARATLTQLEAGSGNPTLETLYALADELGVPLGELIADFGPSPAPRVVRRGEGRSTSGEAVDARLLHRRGELELYALSVRPGAVQRSQPHPPGTREHVHVHSGRVRVGPEDGPLDLGPGDYADYPADVPHRYEVIGDVVAEATLGIVSSEPGATRG